ncbi:transferase family hexapeptide repeat protein [Hypnocyclicus thermotrophus]|uniref:Transferase family hexapeptide repeat protein n=1 Tax=Hypnocyclicus thermotrophus TaxID=1627895 RepID=A0AA46I6G7_9FUSO|nr:acyltransferase [Hypnocyclicus thermotrophus]TDT72445.1 transferase family hexapeptide repeat protein [Hypnocyclicus thermotrophus]
MIKKIIRKLVYKIAIRDKKYMGLYRKICKPRSDEYAEYLKKINYLYSIGEGCRINPYAGFTDPKYVKIGNNTCLSACTIIGHEGAVAVFATATGKVLDKVGKVVIGDNCFVGYGATIMPNVVIGNNSIIASGSVVAKDVPDGVIVGGVPAKVIGLTKDYIIRLEEQTKKYPWYDLIKTRTKVYDDEMEKELLKMRLKYFFEE